jgi:hypothetical protein
MTISAKMILDSVSPIGIRICTLELRYPKFIHGEVMTHRVFSRNASSSRAIPVERLIQDVIDDPAMPSKWFKNKPGMVGTEEIVGLELEVLIEDWLQARDAAVVSARRMIDRGAHKQHINRVIEPFCHINTLVTSTSWANWDALRNHPDADPTIAELARATKAASDASKPMVLAPGQWHLPYVTSQDINLLSGGVVKDHDDLKKIMKISVARCASVSYKTVDGKRMTVDKANEIYDKLLSAQPLHASPAEHQATPDVFTNLGDETVGDRWTWAQPKLHGNFKGWCQYRQLLPNQYVNDEVMNLGQLSAEDAASFAVAE